ncbi:hypothetical protein RYO59_002711 [Thermosynechococcaceae cyanobacterium Okahandja]
MMPVTLSKGDRLYLRDEPFEIIAVYRRLVVVRSLVRSDLSWIVALEEIHKYFAESPNPDPRPLPQTLPVQKPGLHQTN